MRLGPVLLGAVLAVACSKSSPSSETPAMSDARDAAPPAVAIDQRSDAMSTSKDPNPPAPSFERGAAITPSADLLAWLDQQGSRQVRLPMTLVLSSSGSVATATIGVGGEPDPIVVELSDLGMGLSLKDRLRKVCKPGATCTVWLVGKWSSSKRLEVRKLDGEIAADQLAGATHAEVAAE
jgi:hypothetical protein